MVDIEAEKKRIWEATQEWYRLEIEHNADAIVDKFIADDVILQAPGMPQLIGKAACRELMHGLVGAFIHIEGESTRTEVADSGELAYDLGTSTVKLKGPDGPVEDKQKYLIVWKKIDDKWKAVAASFSSDLPSP